MGSTFIRNDQIRAAVIAYLKGRASILAHVTSTEIRETDWQGTTFTYPNIRVRILRNVPSGRTGCIQDVDIGIQVFSEKDSSLQADQIAGIIANELNDKQFTSSGIAFAVIVTNNLEVVRASTTTWRGEVLLTSAIY
jgi:hypothetical protein